MSTLLQGSVLRPVKTLSTQREESSWFQNDINDRWQSLPPLFFDGMHKTGPVQQTYFLLGIVTEVVPIFDLSK